MKTKLNIAAAVVSARSLVTDLGVLAGGAAITYGTWLYTQPLGWIVGGVLLSTGCFLAGYDRRVRSVK